MCRVGGMGQGGEDTDQKLGWGGACIKAQKESVILVAKQEHFLWPWSDFLYVLGLVPASQGETFMTVLTTGFSAHSRGAAYLCVWGMGLDRTGLKVLNGEVLKLLRYLDKWTKVLQYWELFYGIGEVFLDLQGRKGLSHSPAATVAPKDTMFTRT